MTLEQANKIAELVEFETPAVARVREDYSGRGMYGDTCVAVVTDDASAVNWAAGKLDVSWKDTPRRMDNMGLDVVVY